MKEKKGLSNLLDDIVEEAPGELVLELLFDPPVRCNVGEIDLLGGTCTASEKPDDTTIPTKDNRPGITSIGEVAVFTAPDVIACDDDFDRVLMDAVLAVVAGFGLETVDTTEGAECGTSMLHTKQGSHVVLVEVLGVAEFGLWDDATGLQEAVLGVPPVYSIGSLMEHGAAELVGRQITAWGKDINCQLELRQGGGGKRGTDENLIALEIIPVNHIAI